MNHIEKANDLINNFTHAKAYEDSELVSAIICCTNVLNLISELDIEQQAIHIDGKWITALEYWEKIIEEIRKKRFNLTTPA